MNEIDNIDFDNIVDVSLERLSGIAELPRHLVSDGYDEALKLIRSSAESDGLEFQCHEFESGRDCGTWIIPEKWSLDRATLKDRKGNILLDSNVDPMICVSYSEPFDGLVSREELLQHLYVSDNCPNGIPFVFKYYKKDWGLCCTKQQFDSLNDPTYHVSISSRFAKGKLKVGEVIVRGLKSESFILASHLCHPYQVNDGPIGVFPIMNLLKQLSNNRPHYTYRQLIVPENVGSAAWLSKNYQLIDSIKGGIFVEMIGTDLPLRLHRSFDGDTPVDRVLTKVIESGDWQSIVDDFVYANDERQFNGPGVRVPMMGLNRSYMSRLQKDLAAFDNYHSSCDTMANIHRPNLVESVKALWAMLSGVEKYLVRVEANFIGEPFLTRYGLHIDSFDGVDQMRESNEMMDILFNVDGQRCVYEIADRAGVSWQLARQVLDAFHEHDLISYHSL